MTDFERGISENEFWRAKRLLFEQQGDGLWGFVQFAVGELVTIHLAAESCEGLNIEPDQQIIGELRDNRNGVIHVIDAEYQPKLVERDIGLATDTFLTIPISGSVVPVPMAHCVAPKRAMAYYFPEDIPSDAEYGLPKTYEHLALTYQKITVGQMVLFDTVV